MSAKDKAKELVDTYRIMLMNSDTECGEEILCTVIAKYCALIAVDELLEFENRVIEEWKRYFEGKGGEMKVERIFWEEVKHEIQLL
jgi:hypothetical protein